ncbi:mandelate racemase/muconate lactonizing enzyme family protein [Nocardiopsis mangrovi]|uniref:Mandelate racemase/muconate lactonizing enzyme family protein n=1 Tax=Nocardiopsis mangrovi TaxID=1179818 RepID=A0ABV9DVQ8_9ACTN
MTATPVPPLRTPAEYTPDRIAEIRVSSVRVPLPHAISDAKVYTGRQKPLTEVAVLLVEIRSSDGCAGMGFGYSLRSGGPAQYAHACELAPALIDEDAADISRLWEKLVWLNASAGSSGLGIQTIAAFDTALWDLKARRAGLPLAKLIGAHQDSVPCYNTSGGYLNAPIEQVIEAAERSLAAGIGGIKLKVGHPDRRVDLQRVAAVRDRFGPDLPLMVDANQQWDRPRAQRMCQALEEFDLTWIEEPLPAHDVAGHATLANSVRTPIATGEMAGSSADLEKLIDHGAAGVLQPDAPRIGGVTPFLDVLAQARRARLQLAPHFVMELHLPLAATFPGQVWVEHIEWLEPLFEERIRIADGRMHLSAAPGLGLTLSEQARALTSDTRLIARPR